MRHRILGAVVVMAMAGLVGPAAAQQSARPGLGIGLKSLAIDFSEASLVPQIYIPIQMGDRVLFEPSFGIYRFSESNTSGSFSYSMKGQAVLVGAGLLLTRAAGEDGRVYYGPRLTVIKVSSEDEYSGGGTDTAGRTDLALAGVAGGEYFLVDGFSLGGEIGLEYRRVGDETGTYASDVERSGNLIRTTTELRVRWYPR